MAKIRIANVIPHETYTVDEETGESTLSGMEYEVIFKITNDAGKIKTFPYRTTADVGTVEEAWKNRNEQELTEFLGNIEEEPGRVIGKYFNPGRGVEDTPAEDVLDDLKPGPPDNVEPGPPEDVTPGPPEQVTPGNK